MKSTILGGEKIILEKSFGLNLVITLVAGEIFQKENNFVRERRERLGTCKPCMTLNGYMCIIRGDCLCNEGVALATTKFLFLLNG